MVLRRQGGPLYVGKIVAQRGHGSEGGRAPNCTEIWLLTELARANICSLELTFPKASSLEPTPSREQLDRANPSSLKPTHLLTWVYFGNLKRVF